MRFERLHLIAFGPFTDEVLDLSGGAPGGLHVIYGPNEAGKSTSLRAVRNFLYGMPTRSPDAHLHPSPKLAISAQLSHAGQELSLTRIKRRKDDLLGPDGLPIAEDPLPALLGYLDERTFSQRFGLDQAELEKGAEALLGGSEQGLFAAGTAGADVRRVLDALKVEYEGLYLPRGKIPALNRQLEEYDHARTEARRSERPPEKWIEQERAYQEAAAHVARFKSERRQVRADQGRLNRLRAVIGDLADWETHNNKNSLLKDVVELHPEAPQKRESLTQRLAELRVEARRIQQEIQNFQEELDHLPLESPLAEVDDEQLELNARVGTALSARKDMPKRRARLLELERQLAGYLRDLGREVSPSQEVSLAEEVVIGDEVTSAVRRLLTERGALHAELQEADKRFVELTAEMEHLEKASHEAPSSASMAHLEALLSEASSLAGLESELRLAERELLETRAACEGLRAKRQFCSTDTESAAVLPRLENMLDRESAFRADVTSLAKASERERQLREQQTRLQRLLEGHRELDVPSRERLLLIRGQRDEVLSAHGRDQATLDVIQLARLIEQSDQMSDRLVSEADRVAELSSLRQKSQEIREEIEKTILTRQEHQVRAREFEEEFASACHALELKHVPAVDQLAGLTRDLAEFLRRQERYKALRQLCTNRRQKLDACCAPLTAALGDQSVSSLPALVELASRRLREGEKSVERRAHWLERVNKLSRDCSVARARLDNARAVFLDWQRSWGDAVRPLGLDADVSIFRAQEVLSTLERIGRSLDQARDLLRRIDGMRRDTEALGRDVRHIAEQHAPELLQQDPVDAAVRLQEAILKARSTRDERIRIRRNLQERRAQLSAIELDMQQVSEQLGQLFSAAGVGSVEALIKAEVASAEKRSVRQELERLAGRIRELSDGTPLSELLQEARPWQGSVNRLVAEVNDLGDRNNELDEALREAESEAESLRLGLQSYASEDVALARQAAADRASAARESLRQYLVKRAAHVLLERQVERYAERFSGPILARAAELFERITLGKYSRLSVGLGQKVLRCVSGGHEKEVHELSEGARAQLYFVLRIASLESYFEEQGPVPLVFDDLFQSFDDDRATVAFEILAEIAERTQVLYFTHLGRDVEKAHDAIPGERLFSHAIGVV